MSIQAASQSTECTIITKATLQKARDACAVASNAGKEKTAADKLRDAALGQLFFEMGFFNLEQVRSLTPEQLAAEIKRRTGSAFELAPDAQGLFVLQKTSEGKYPRWKEEFVLLNGPLEAAKIEDETAKQYSYAIVDIGKAKPGSGGLLLGEPARGRKK